MFQRGRVPLCARSRQRFGFVCASEEVQKGNYAKVEFRRFDPHVGNKRTYCYWLSVEEEESLILKSCGLIKRSIAWPQNRGDRHRPDTTCERSNRKTESDKSSR